MIFLKSSCTFLEIDLIFLMYCTVICSVNTVLKEFGGGLWVIVYNVILMLSTHAVCFIPEAHIIDTHLGSFGFGRSILMRKQYL